MSGTERKFNFKAGIIGSLIGGLIIAIPMGMMGSLPGIASMVGSDSAIVGFIVHMVISFIFGIAFAVFAGMIKTHPAVTGAIFGVIIWVIGPLLLMPMLMGGTGACGTAACGTADYSACGTASQSACGTADKSACGTASKSACGTADKSACGTASKSACGAADKSACGTASATACGTANPCGGAGASGMLMSLAIHLLYGLITGLTFKMVAKKA
jgi:hypothetical protein